MNDPRVFPVAHTGQDSNLNRRRSARSATVYCDGEPVEAFAVFLAELSPSGRPRVQSNVPVYWRCSGCDGILPRSFGVGC